MVSQSLLAFKGSTNEDLSTLLNSLENQLNDAKGTESSDSGLKKSQASIYETGISLDGNIAYLVIEDSGVRYHQSLFDSESDRLSLLDDIVSYEGSHSIHKIGGQDGQEIFKVKKERKTVGFLQFKKEKGKESIFSIEPKRFSKQPGTHSTKWPQ